MVAIDEIFLWISYEDTQITNSNNKNYKNNINNNNDTHLLEVFVIINELSFLGILQPVVLNKVI